MKDAELEQLLKAAKVPEKPEAYWQHFPKRVTAKLHWQETIASVRATNQGRKLNFHLAWAMALALVCAVIAVFFINQPKQPAADTTSDHQLAEARICYQELETLFPNQLRAIVFDQHGPRMVLADKAVVPDSTPFYLKICGSSGCQGFVTFSGQVIQYGGENCEVLADGQGRVMLVGSTRVWQENNPADSVRIQATPLEAAL